jgi:hypothetical protein
MWEKSDPLYIERVLRVAVLLSVFFPVTIASKKSEFPAACNFPHYLRILCLAVIDMSYRY